MFSDITFFISNYFSVRLYWCMTFFNGHGEGIKSTRKTQCYLSMPH